MDEAQKKMWAEWPLKIMVGECSEEYGIKLKDLFRLAGEFMDHGVITDKDEAGLLIVLGNSQIIHNVELKNVVAWEDTSVNTDQ